MKGLLATMLAMAMFVPAVLATQGKTDFSGTWTLDESKSTPAPTTPPAVGSIILNVRPTLLVITQTPVEMAVELTASDTWALSGARNRTPGRLFQSKVVYRLDGSEFPANCPPCDAIGTSTWDGGKLVVSAKRKLYAGRIGYITTEDKETFSVADNVLTLERILDTSQGSQSRTLVYNRKP